MSEKTVIKSDASLRGKVRDVAKGLYQKPIFRGSSWKRKTWL